MNGSKSTEEQIIGIPKYALVGDQLGEIGNQPVWTGLPFQVGFSIWSSF